jgi:hypothetical protein
MTAGHCHHDHEMRAWILAVAASCAACSSGAKPDFYCPKGTAPCGNGCRPAEAVCCEDSNDSKSSSYCTNGAGGGCYPNPNGGCAAAVPSGAVAKFCCSSNTSIGSNDCPEGQHHCGLLCQANSVPCCAKNASDADCPTKSGSASEGVGCGCCRATGVCYQCNTGYCCGGSDPCTGNGQCFPGGRVCVAVAPSGGGSGTCPGGWMGSLASCFPLGPGGSCTCSSGSTNTCITKTDFESRTGLPFPPACTPQGSGGCLNSYGTLANPCCPGLTCVISSTCGQQGSQVGGTCQVR